MPATLVLRRNLHRRSRTCVHQVDDCPWRFLIPETGLGVSRGQQRKNCPQGGERTRPSGRQEHDQIPLAGEENLRRNILPRKTSVDKLGSRTRAPPLSPTLREVGFVEPTHKRRHCPTRNHRPCFPFCFPPVHSLSHE